METNASEETHEEVQGLSQIEQPYRTGYHFQPSKNWMNDPNGPVYYKGVYHFFYQYNPEGPTWGNIVWAHSISYDLVDWIHLEDILKPTDTFDINGCFSGSITILPGDEPVILYTGVDANKHQLQCSAVPKDLSDPFLREWTKSKHNPLMIPSNDGIDPDNFRDPTTAWQGSDGAWRTLIGAEVAGAGTALLYKSKDFERWAKAEKPLYSSPKTGMWECPDFFRVGNGKHVLKVSFRAQDYYVLGNYSPETDEFVPETDFLDFGADFRHDYGKFYACKSFHDAEKNRMVMWGWVPEADSESDAFEKGWAGLQAIPRSVELSDCGKQLVLWPVKEIEKLRGDKFSIQDMELLGGQVYEIPGLTASQADVEIAFDLGALENVENMDPSWEGLDAQSLFTKIGSSDIGKIGPFGLLVLASEDLTEQTAIYFRVLKGSDNKHVVLLCNDLTKSSLKEEGLDKTSHAAFVYMDLTKEKLTLRTLIDHSIIESFGGQGKSCITSRVYPKLAIHKEARLFAFNKGSESVKISTLDAWSMKSANFETNIKTDQ